MIEKFPFRIHTIWTDRGHEFQAKFHWHVADKGIRHVYIKPRTLQLDAKVERSLRTEKQGFYQLLTYEEVMLIWKGNSPNGRTSTATPVHTVRLPARLLTKP